MYQRKTRGWSQHIDFMAFDLLSLELSLFLAFTLRLGIPELFNRRMFWGLFIFLPFVDLAVMVVIDTYHGVIRRDSYHELTKLLNQSSYLALVFSAFLIFYQTQAENSGFIFFTTMLLYMAICYAVRSVWKGHLQRRLHIKNRTGLLVVATVDRLHDVVSTLVNHNYNSYRFVGVALLDKDLPSTDGEEALQNIKMGSKEVNLEIVAGRDELLSYLVKNWVDEVYFDVPGQIPIELINRIMDMGITVHMALADIDQIIARHKNIEWICGQATITASLGYVSQRDLMLKRLMDIAGGFVGCVFTVLLTIILAPLIYLSSPGPIFFHQTRIGENGRKFEMYKFRSMYPDAEKRKKELQSGGGDDELMFKMEHDPRIIGMKQRKDGTWKKGVGGWIRDLSLDEFPQFFNVLKGDMSLVGTRPPTVDEWAQYTPHYRSRMSTKPGLTGMWQVSGRSKIRDFEKVVQLDREYIENWSLKLDWQILVRTAWVVVARRGAM